MPHLSSTEERSSSSYCISVAYTGWMGGGWMDHWEGEREMTILEFPVLNLFCWILMNTRRGFIIPFQRFLVAQDPMNLFAVIPQYSIFIAFIIFDFKTKMLQIFIMSTDKKSKVWKPLQQLLYLVNLNSNLHVNFVVKIKKPYPL